MNATLDGRRLGWFDMALLCVFLIGIYTGFTIYVSPRVPFPSVPSGIAGMVLLWRRRNQITPAGLGAFVGVLLLYLVSILCATDLSFLGRRFNGLVQLTYSITIGYALFLTVAEAERRQIARLFLGFSLVIVVGCVFEDFGGLRAISDQARLHLYSSGIYDSDLRDELLYGRVRPKLFASEPSAVTFAFTLFTFVWLVTSAWRWKLLVYLALMGVSIVVMPGPTLLLMLLLIVPYELFLAGRSGGPRGNHISMAQILKIACVSVVLVGTFIVMANTVFSERLKEITSGNDPSFFYRVLGPAIAARGVIENYPIAGAGLTGEPYVENQIIDVYVRSPSYSSGWRVVSPATELLINYFWLHWIYLGLVWGIVMLAAVSGWLRVLGVRKVLFCWLVWAVLGQASGAYVGPKAWAVLLLAAAGAMLCQRQAAESRTSSPRPMAPVSGVQLALARAANRRAPG